MSQWLDDIDKCLKPFQIPVRDFIINTPKCAVFLNMGGGKTLTTLNALGHIRPAGHILVVSPPEITKNTWPDEVRDWNIPLNVISLAVRPNKRNPNKTVALTKAERHELYSQINSTPPSLYLITSDLIVDLIDYIATNGFTRRTMKYDTWPFRTIVIDESQLFKNPRAKRFKALRKIVEYTDRIIELTGTPSSESIESLWSQMYLLDQGEALGKTITEFRETWMMPDPRTARAQFTKWLPKPGAEHHIHQHISHMAMSAFNDELDVPECSIVTHYIDLPEPLQLDYEKFKKDCVMELAGDTTDDDVDDDAEYDDLADTLITADNAAALRIKLLQFATGKMYTDPELSVNEDGDIVTGPRDVIHVHDHKVEKLRSILDDHDGTPVLIAYRFISEIDHIISHLADHGYTAQVYDKTTYMKNQWNKGDVPIMLIHPKSAGHGLNLQHGGYTLIWYSLADSSEQYMQTNARLHRMGQTHDVTIHRLVVDRTYEDAIPAILAGKITKQDALLQSLRR